MTASPEVGPVLRRDADLMIKREQQRAAKSDKNHARLVRLGISSVIAIGLKSRIQKLKD